MSPVIHCENYWSNSSLKKGRYLARKDMQYAFMTKLGYHLNNFTINAVHVSMTAVGHFVSGDEFELWETCGIEKTNIRPSSQFSAKSTYPISPPHSTVSPSSQWEYAGDASRSCVAAVPMTQHAAGGRASARPIPGATDSIFSVSLRSCRISGRSGTDERGGRELISTEQRPARHVETAILAAADVASSPLENSAENSARQTSDRRQGTNEFMLCARACYSQERCDVDRYMRSHDTNFGCTAFVLGCVKPMTTLCVKKPVRHFRSD